MSRGSARVNPLIIAGMPRSGTTLLQRLCYLHPQMRVTKEFGNYSFVGDPLSSYMRDTVKRVNEINGRWRILGTPGQLPTALLNKLRFRGVNHAANMRVVTAHLLRLARNGRGPVTLSALVAEARRRDSRTRVVGDKLPQYIFMMDRLVDLPGLLRLVIYRDCRDVASSYLLMTRTKWRDRPWIRGTDTAEKIARSWVQAIEIMERYADRLFTIRYEDLVADPSTELHRLAQWLDVDPSGFKTNRISASSVGNYKKGLTDQELDEVLRVAGPTMERLKYPLE